MILMLVTYLVGIVPIWWFIASAASRKKNRLRWALLGALSYFVPAIAAQSILREFASSPLHSLIGTVVCIGMGLLAAAWVHHHLARLRLPAETETALLALIATGNRVEAIKRIAKLTGVSLSESKAYVDKLAARSTPLPWATESSTGAGRHLELAWGYEVLDAFESALRECELAIELAPDCAEAHNLRGIILESLGRGQEAIEAYRKAARLDPMFSEARENLDDAEAEFGKVEQGG